MSSGWVALIMLGVFILIAAAFAWQEQARLPERSIVYGSDEAVEYVTSRLSPAAAAALTERDVRRILEWELEYLQRQMVDGEEAIVVAGLDAARHAQERLHEQGHSYDGPLIVEVMELQADYLLAIGAVAEAAAPEEIDEVFRDAESDDPDEAT